MAHKGSKTKMTYHLCLKCGAKKKLLKTAKFQHVGEPSLREYKTSMLRPAEYEFRSRAGKLLKSSPNCIGISYAKYGSMINQISMFDLEKEK